MSASFKAVGTLLRAVFTPFREPVPDSIPHAYAQLRRMCLEVRPGAQAMITLDGLLCCFTCDPEVDGQMLEVIVHIKAHADIVNGQRVVSASVKLSAAGSIDLAYLNQADDMIEDALFFVHTARTCLNRWGWMS